MDMSKVYQDCHYHARTLAIWLVDLDDAQQTQILDYLMDELERLKRDRAIYDASPERVSDIIE